MSFHILRQTCISIMRRQLKILILFLFLIGFQVLLFENLFKFKIFKSSKLGNSAWSPLVHEKSLTREPLILLLNEWYHDPYWGFHWVDKKETSALHLFNCPHKCHFTIDNERYKDTADMVIANTYYYGQPPNSTLSRERILENQRKTDQIWAGATLEGPVYQKRRGREIDDVFHWFATCRRDADIFWPSWSYTKRSVPLKAAPGRKKSKKKLVAWLVSHCTTHSQRELLVETLQRYIPVDIYGKCGKPCPEGLDCREYLAANYKFYLALENSLCLDYVTEKLFRMQKTKDHIVPVTYSWINDTSLIPPNSYIDARDFGSIKALADYLQYLDKNDDEYRGYMQWKTDYEIVKAPNDAKLCQACQMLLSYKKDRACGGGRMKRRPSMLSWMNSLGSGQNFSYFKVAGNLVQTTTVCFDPLKNEASANWLRGS